MCHLNINSLRKINSNLFKSTISPIFDIFLVSEKKILKWQAKQQQALET